MPLGSLFGPLEAVLDGLGPPKSMKKYFEGLLGPLWAHLGPSWAALVPEWVPKIILKVIQKVSRNCSRK